MDHEVISYLRSNSRAWKLLRADNAPLILSVLGTIFILDNARTLSESDLIARVDDYIYAINAGLPGDDDTTGDDVHREGRAPDDLSMAGVPKVDQEGRTAAYRGTARAYVEAWARPDTGWLRKFYPDGASEAHYDATSDLEKAYSWVSALQSRSFVGTESRLHTVIDLLRQMVHGAETDPQARLTRLLGQRAALDAEIARAEAGVTTPMDSAGLLDRYQHLSSTARELLSDFREVEENFRALDRGAREKIAGWDGSKGDLIEELVGDRHAIAASDQGRSFQAFHEFLLSRSSREELTELLDRLVDLDGVPVDPRLRHIHHDWLDAAERTQHTVRLLSEQLRRFLDDKVWLENRRVIELLRSIERHAVALRDAPGPAPGCGLDALAPTLRLPMERPLYAPGHETDFTQVVVHDSAVSLDASVLFDQAYVDTARLLDTVRRALRGRDQVALEAVLADHPATLGLAEIIGYLTISTDDVTVVSDESAQALIPYRDSLGRERVVRMPRASFVRHSPLGSASRAS